MKKIILPALLLFSSLSFAQLAVTNTGNMQLHSGASVASYGNFTNNSSASLVNNGSLYLKKDISNDQGSMNAGTGSLYLDGNTVQDLNGTATFKTFNLVTDNTQGITLNNDLSVAGTHTFTNGMITTGTGSTTIYMIYENGSSYSGASDTRHVNGWVKKIGSGNFSFPVGNETYLRPIGISSLSASSEFNCHFYRPTKNIYNLWSPIVQVKANEYWQLDKISGGTAQVDLNWDHAKYPMENIILGDIRAVYYTAGSWHNAGGSASGTVTATGSISSNTLTAFGEITIGSTAYPVPLKLISFTGERRVGTSYLNWITVNEENLSHFEVQRSYDAVNYSAIGTTTARNLVSRQVYYFEDHAYLEGTAYYRLKSIDVNGQSVFSRVVALQESQSGIAGFYVINPARNAISIFNRSGFEGQFQYRLFNAAGQLQLSGTVSMVGNGNAVVPLPPGIATGIYLLELSKDKIRTRQQVLVSQ